MAAPYRYIKKIAEIGNSKYICLPALWCKANKIKKGRECVVELHMDKVIITLNGKDGLRRR